MTAHNGRPLCTNFYPRPPRGGRPTVYATRKTASNFYPRPPRGGRRCSARFSGIMSVFLSTPSARRATQHVHQDNGRNVISIHALREEGDQAHQGAVDLTDLISIHALREEGDFWRFPWTGCWAKFLSTPSARRATKYSGNDLDCDEISIHALREEGDRCDRRFRCKSTTFLSTPSARRATPAIFLCKFSDFISIHALREEGDFCGSGSAPV